jgi:hypothetical protein
VIGGKPIAVLLQSISAASAINRLVALYDIYGRKREVILFYFVPDTTRDMILIFMIYMHLFTRVDFGLIGFVPTTLYLYIHL